MVENKIVISSFKSIYSQLSQTVPYCRNQKRNLTKFPYILDNHGKQKLMMAGMIVYNYIYTGKKKKLCLEWLLEVPVG